MLKRAEARSRVVSSVRRPFAVFLALLIAPTAAAFAEVHLATPENVALDGAATVVMPDGRVRVGERDFTGEVVFLLANATAVTWEWEEAGVPQGAIVPGAWPIATDAIATYHDLGTGPLRVEFDDELAVLIVLPNGTARTTVTASVAPSGHPVATPPTGTTQGIAYEDPLWEPPASSPVFECPGGWWLQGDWLGVKGWPAVGGARIETEGRLRVGLKTGKVTAATAEGPLTVRLGRTILQEGVGEAQAGRRERVREMFIDGDGTFLADGVADWAACGAEQRIDIVGRATWRHADGEAAQGNATRRFQGATVEMAGSFTLAPRGNAGQQGRYDARGDADVHVDGTRVQMASAAAAVDAPTVTLAAVILLVFLAAAKGAAVLYTRFRPDELLAHPRRSAIHDIVHAHPGIHKRELHRRAGGAWGAFAFHLQLLEKARYVKEVRTGGFVQVYPLGVTVDAVAATVPHPRLQSFYRALPPDGTRVPLKDLRQRLGLSNQLANYHLTRLQAQGLVTVEGSVFGPKRVGRTTSGPR